MVRCMGMKLLKSKSDYPRRTQYYRGALYPALHKLEAEGILDVEIER
jgi:DNA-binding PadR family transcriptional regulator